MLELGHNSARRALFVLRGNSKLLEQLPVVDLHSHSFGQL